MAKKKQKPKAKAKPYDYQLLAAKPRVFGFFVGWYGQGLLNRVYESAAGRSSAESSGGWDSCRTEVCRLGAMIDAWSTIHDKTLSSELVEAMHSVARLCSPEGYPGTPEGIKGTAFQPCYDAPPTSLPGCELWPNVLDGNTEFGGEFGALVQNIHSVFTMIWELTSQKNAAAAGAALCRLAFGDVRSDTNTEPHRWIGSLASLGLFPVSRGYKTAPLHKQAVIMLEHLKDSWTLEDEDDVLLNMPLFVCDHADLPCPPDRSDVEGFPVFREHTPALVAPAETTEIAPQSEPAPEESADSADFRLTLMEFVRDYCEATGGKMSPRLLKSRVKSLMSAARRDELELPPCQENWRPGQSKKYRMSDLKQCWRELRSAQVGLPALKK